MIRVKFFSVFIISFFMLLAQPVFAEEAVRQEVKDNAVVNQEWTVKSGKTDYFARASTSDGIAMMLATGVRITRIILGSVGVLVLAMFVWGGFEWLISAGDAGKVKSGKDKMKNAVIGMIIVFTAYIMVQFAVTNLGLAGSAKP